MLDQFLKLTDSACSIGLTSGFSIFSLEIRWYALSYIFGLILGQIYLKNIIKLNHYKGFIQEKHIDCLLYTSPSPRDRTRSRMPSSA